VGKREQMQRERSVRRKGRIIAGVAAVALGGGMLLLPVMTASAAAPPTAYGADATGKALYQVYNAVAAVDPSLPGSRSAVQVNPSASPPILLTTYGYANDPGTLVGAVVFAPPSPTCTSDPLPPGCGPTPPAVTPANFPGLAEAFYPQPDQEHVAKCAANTDASNAQGNSACDQSNTGTWYAVADASPKNPLGPSARGFASEAGPNVAGTPFAVKQLSSESNVTPDKDGNLTVTQENKGQDITIAGTPLAASFEASSHLKSTADAVTGDAVCTIDFTMGGQAIPIDQAQAILSQVGSVPGAPYDFQFAPPTPPVVQTDNLGGSASCQGATLQVTDHATGSSATYIFGTTVSRAARLGQTLSAGGGDSGSSTPSSGSFGGDGSSGFTSGGSSGAALSAPSSTGTDTGSAPVEAAAAPTEPQAAPEASAPPAQGVSNGPGLITKKINATPVGIVTALGTIGVLLGSWLLLSSIAGLGKGGIRLAGWQAKS